MNNKLGLTQHKIGQRICDYCMKGVVGDFGNVIVRDDEGISIYNGHEECMSVIRQSVRNKVEVPHFKEKFVEVSTNIDNELLEGKTVENTLNRQTPRAEDYEQKEYVPESPFIEHR